MTDVRRALAATMSVEASRWLDALDADQRLIAHWDFPDDDERRQWFYTPTDHGGLTLGQMSSTQQRLAFRLLASGLSHAGYVTMATIIGLENVLDHLEGFTASWNHPRGRDPQRYYVRVFGDPASGTWSWRAGGHHISLNFTIIDGAVAGTTPLFLGADPASSPLLGPHLLRPLEGVEDLARELTRSLDARQRPRAVVTPRAPSDLVLVNRSTISDGDGPLPLQAIWRGQLPGEFHDLAVRIQDGADAAIPLTIDDLTAMSFTTTPKGLAASEMNADQREMLDTLLRRYVDRLPDALAEEEAAKFVGDRLDGVHLLWAGSVEPGEAHYYRLQSPLLLAEYDNTARGANHVHTVWRNPQGDFADDVLRRHHATHDH